MPAFLALPVLKWLASWLSSSVFGQILEGYKAKLDAGNTHDRLAGDLAAREMVVQQAEVQAQYALRTAQIGHPWEPEKLAMYITLIFYAKVIIWDKVLGLGTTDALGGAVGVWAQMIMAFYFSKRGFENVTRIITSRWGK